MEDSRNHKYRFVAHTKTQGVGPSPRTDVSTQVKEFKRKGKRWGRGCVNRPIDISRKKHRKQRAERILKAG